MFPDDLLIQVHSVKGESSLAARSEVERRREYIDIMIGGLNGDENHPLVVLVKECLANEPEERPTAEEIVRRLQQKGHSKQLIHVVKKVYVRVLIGGYKNLLMTFCVVGGSKQTASGDKQ